MIIKKEDNTVNYIKQIENILNTEKYKNYSTKQKIHMLYFKYTMLCLNIDEINFEYLKETSSSYGIYLEDKNLLSINPKEIKAKSSIGSLTTVAHELRHAFQFQENKPFKQPNVCKKSSYPIEVFDSYLYYILNLRNIDLYKYYYSSRLEKDARDYSIKSVKFLYNIIYLECNKNTYAHKWAKKELKRIKKLEIKEEKKYDKAFNHVEKTYKQLCNIVKYNILKLIKINLYNLSENKNSDLIQYLKKHFQNYLYIYCDDEITNKIISYCIQADDVETLYMFLNHPYTKITEQQFDDCIKFIKKSTFCNAKDIANSLYNWKKDFIETYFYESDNNSTKSYSLDSIFENRKKFTNKLKLKNLVAYKNIKFSNLEKKRTKQ